MKLTHRLVTLAPYLISSKIAWRISKFFLAIQGIGWGGEIESSGELSLIERQLSKLKQPVIFDVGAHLGDYALACLDANGEAIVHCFEPSKRHYEEMQKRLDKLSKNLILNQFGLSNKNGCFTLYKDKEISGLASTNKRNLEHLGIDFSVEERCEFYDAAEYCKKQKVTFIDLLKIDVEGAEFQILNALKVMFENKKISMCQFEFGHANIESKLYFKDFFDFFRCLDYELAILLPNGVLDPIKHYEERYENLYIANFVATLKSTD
jgi:FkbM family methyltransferase